LLHVILRSFDTTVVSSSYDMHPNPITVRSLLEDSEDPIPKISQTNPK
jgi:hypothetical protein